MQKLKLETLAVTSFDTGAASPDTDRYTSCVPECASNLGCNTLQDPGTIMI